MFSVLRWECVYTFAILENKFRPCFLHRFSKFIGGACERDVSLLFVTGEMEIQNGAAMFFRVEDLIRSSPIAKPKASASLFTIS